MHVNGKLLENIQEENNVVTLKEHVININVENIHIDVNLLDLQLQEFISQNVNGLEEDHLKEEDNVVHSQKDVKTINVKQEKSFVNLQLESFIMDVDGKELQNVLIKKKQHVITHLLLQEINLVTLHF